jgi:hypothetical protein
MRIKVTVPVDLSTYPRLTYKSLFYFIADSLREEQVKTIVYDEEKIQFSAGLFRTLWDWAPLSTIHGGEINFKVEPERIVVISHLSFMDTAVIASLLVGLMAYANYRIFLLGKDDQIFYVVAWLGIVGGNMLLSMNKWRHFIQHCVQDAADRVAVSKEEILANIRVQN